MRVGIFTESYPPLINGVSTSVQTLIAHLEQAGHDVFVFTSRYPRYQDERPGVFRYPSVNALVEPDYVLPIPFSPRIARVIPDAGPGHRAFAVAVFSRPATPAASPGRLNLPHIATNHTLYTEYAHYLPLPTVGDDALDGWCAGCAAFTTPATAFSRLRN